LVRDGGVDHPVIKLGRGFHQFTVEHTDVFVGAGLPDRIVAERCQALGLSGLEFLFTIPGTIGGALRMNAGCYGAETADRLVSVEVMDPKGIRYTLSIKEITYGYRFCSVPEDWVFLGARFRCISAKPEKIAKTMLTFSQQREDTQPTHVRTGGSTFANPDGYAAWELIDAVGYRGKKRGGASISQKHCNFLINEGDATAADLEGLGEEARQKVLADKGIALSWEIDRWGKL
jgi:UDP-N-acetylmuramate dehydrogenase